MNPAPAYFLMKAEPDSRIVKGKDVKFSIDDFEAAGTTEWDGVRNHEAKNLMKNLMKVGHQVLFYHSNTKQPGVFGIAKIIEEGHPDESAFDVNHPYYDPKSKREVPTWYTPTLEFVSRLSHPILLSDFKRLATLDPGDQAKLKEEGFGVLTSEEIRSIQEMPLLNRGRLSVQTVSDLAFHSIIKLGEKGVVNHPIPSVGDVAGGNASSRLKVKSGIDSVPGSRSETSLSRKRRKIEPTRKNDKNAIEEGLVKPVKVLKEDVISTTADEGLRRSKRNKV